jgi:hypothetical protein
MMTPTLSYTQPISAFSNVERTAHVRQRQEDHKFEASKGYIAKLTLKLSNRAGTIACETLSSISSIRTTKLILKNSKKL